MSLPSREAWIEIIPEPFPVTAPAQGRFPRGKRGLKYVLDLKYGKGVLGRFPRGKRGLKSPAAAKKTDRTMSLPSREAWIEIAGEKRESSSIVSLPSREAWIEIDFHSVCRLQR